MSWCNLKLAQRKRLQLYQTRSHAIFSTLYLLYVLRKWYTWRQERIYTANYTNPQSYRESYSRRICIMDVRIFPIPKRAHPPTIKAKEARNTWKLVARGTRELVAVTLITEFQVYLTQQFRKKTVIANTSLKRLIQLFENHPNRDSSMEDLNKTEESVQRKVGVDPLHGARHGSSMRQCMYYKALEMLKESPQQQ